MGTLKITFKPPKASVTITRNDIVHENDVIAYVEKVMSVGLFFQMGSSPTHSFVPADQIDNITYDIVNGQVI